MPRLDRVLKLLEEYDESLELYINEDDTIGYFTLNRLRKEKEALTHELIEHGCRRSGDLISQDIFSEQPAMQKQTWSGGW